MCPAYMILLTFSSTNRRRLQLVHLKPDRDIGDVVILLVNEKVKYM